MPATKRKVKSKSRSRTTSRTTSRPTSLNDLQKLVSKVYNSRSKIQKMNNNLPARLLQLNRGTGSHNQVYSKSISSTYSSTMHDGHVHQEGKQVVNDSTKPFIQISELQNDQVKHYMLPRNGATSRGDNKYVFHIPKSTSRSRSRSKSRSRKGKTKARKTKARKTKSKTKSKH